MDADPQKQLQALREQGAAARDPVRWCHIEALARRAQAHQGETRRLLDERLRGLLAGFGAQPLATPPAVDAAAFHPRAQTLADLLAHLARHAVEPGAAGAMDAPAAATPRPLRSVSRDKSTWSRLSVDQRMTQSRARVPDNAGPLNTQRLLHQALTLMRGASPEYVHRFIGHVEALLQLDTHGLADIGPRREAPRASREARDTRKSGLSRSD